MAGAELGEAQGQVAIALHPARERIADDGLGGGPHDQRFFQLSRGHELAVGADLEAMMRDDRAFFGEAFDVGRFLLQEGQRNEQREVSVLMARRFEFVIQDALHILPQGITPGLDDHAAAHGGSLGKIGGANDLLVPLGVIVLARGHDGCSGFIHRSGPVE